MSRNGFSPRCWSAAFWHMLHVTSFNYPEEPEATDRWNYYNFLMFAGSVLPCGTCRRNFPASVRGLCVPPGMSKAEVIRCAVFNNRASLSMWLYALHREIWSHTNPEGGETFPSYTEMAQTYEAMRAKPSGGSRYRCLLRILRSEKCEGKKTFQMHSG
jgi:hypothetical protein